jgi:hypothetical protein
MNKIIDLKNQPLSLIYREYFSLAQFKVLRYEDTLTILSTFLGVLYLGMGGVTTSKVVFRTLNYVNNNKLFLQIYWTQNICKPELCHIKSVREDGKGKEGARCRMLSCGSLPLPPRTSAGWPTCVFRSSEISCAKYTSNLKMPKKHLHIVLCHLILFIKQLFLSHSSLSNFPLTLYKKLTMHLRKHL